MSVDEFGLRRGRQSIQGLTRDEHNFNVHYGGGPQGREEQRPQRNLTELHASKYVDPQRATPYNSASQVNWDSAQAGQSGPPAIGGALEAIVAARTAQRQAEGPTVHPHLRNPYQDHP